MEKANQNQEANKAITPVWPPRKRKKCNRGISQLPVKIPRSVPQLFVSYEEMLLSAIGRISTSKQERKGEDKRGGDFRHTEIFIYTQREIRERMSTFLRVRVEM